MDSFSNGTFNPTTGVYWHDSALFSNGTGIYDATHPRFLTPAAAGVPLPEVGINYIGAYQIRAGQNERSPLAVGTESGPHIAEYYCEWYLYAPANFEWGNWKLFRSGRLVSSFVGNWISLESGQCPSGTFAAQPSVASVLFPSGNDGSNGAENNQYLTWPGRNQWVRIGVWAKWNTAPGGVAASDGFFKVYFNGALVRSVVNYKFSTNAAHITGFNLIRVGLNMSYGACTGVATTDSRAFMGPVRLYATKP